MRKVLFAVAALGLIGFTASTAQADHRVRHQVHKHYHGGHCPTYRVPHGHHHRYYGGYSRGYGYPSRYGNFGYYGGGYRYGPYGYRGYGGYGRYGGIGIQGRRFSLQLGF